MFLVYFSELNNDLEQISNFFTIFQLMNMIIYDQFCLELWLFNNFVMNVVTQ